MSQAPQDAQQQPSTADKMKGFASAFGKKVKAGAEKAAANVKAFVEDAKEDHNNSKSMEGLVKLASTEFQEYIKKRSGTTDKNETLKKIADSFKNAEGICFVTRFSVAFTGGVAYGRGIVMKRLGPGNWSLPLAIQEFEGSAGFQLSVSISKSFLVLRNDQALQNFQQKGNAKLSGQGFAALGNLGIEAQGNVKASKESLTKTTDDAAQVAATNASVGSKKGLALGVSVGLGTFQQCKKINEATYENFDIKKIFDKGVNDAEASATGGQANGANVNEPGAEEKVQETENKVKNDAFLGQLQEFIQLLEGVIHVEKAQEQ